MHPEGIFYPWWWDGQEGEGKGDSNDSSRQRLRWLVNEAPPVHRGSKVEQLECDTPTSCLLDCGQDDSPLSLYFLTCTLRIMAVSPLWEQREEPVR